MKFMLVLYQAGSEGTREISAPVVPKEHFPGRPLVSEEPGDERNVRREVTPVGLTFRKR